MPEAAREPLLALLETKPEERSLPDLLRPPTRKPAVAPEPLSENADADAAGGEDAEPLEEENDLSRAAIRAYETDMRRRRGKGWRPRRQPAGAPNEATPVAPFVGSLIFAILAGVVVVGLLLGVSSIAAKLFGGSFYGVSLEEAIAVCLMGFLAWATLSRPREPPSRRRKG